MSADRDRWARAGGSETLPPHNEAAEARVLGALLIIGSIETGDPDAGAAAIAEQVVARLRVDDFSREWHRQVYRAILRAKRSGPWGYQAVCRALEDAGHLQQRQEQGDVAGLVSAPANIALTLDDVEAVRDAAIRRDLLRVSGDIAAAAYRPSAGRAVAEAQAWLEKVAGRLDAPIPSHSAGPTLVTAWRQAVEIPE